MRREPSIQMPRRKPISPTVAPMYADNREPAANTSNTSPGVASRTRRDEHDRADVTGAEDRPAQRYAKPHCS